MASGSATPEIQASNVVPSSDANDLVVATSDNDASKRKRKQTSTVWQHFDIIEVGKDEKQKCKCKQCGQTYLSDSKYGTGNLKRHLMNCKRRDTRDIGQLLLTQPTSSNVANKFDPVKFRELVTSAIVMHNLPLGFTEWIGIRNILLYLRDDLHLVTRNTNRSDCLKLYKKEKQRIKKMLADCPGFISFTSDCWTSVVTDGPICLTAHFIDRRWNLLKLILNFCLMPPPHTGIALAEKITSFLVDWGIEKKVFTITLDNASNNDSSVDMLRDQLRRKGALICDGDYLHLRCCVHIVNLIVQEGLKDVDNSVRKIRDSIKYIKGSQSRKKKFLECISFCCLDSKRGLRQDLPTRWSSTFIMLDSALYYKDAFNHMKLADSNFKDCPSDDEWGRAEAISKFLGLFYKITLVFSGTKYATSNQFFLNVFAAYVALKQELEGENQHLKSMARLMHTKFSKYWSDFNVLLALAVILDPRYKFYFVEWCYKRVYGDDGYFEAMKIKDRLFILYSHYSNFETASQTSPTSCHSRNNSSGHGMDDYNDLIISSKDVLMEFDSFETPNAFPQKSQLELYLDEPRIDRQAKINILAYWRDNQFRFPEVAAMARDILAIPVSTVASENAFSSGGKVIDQYRSSLKPQLVEALVCTKDWLYGHQHQQELDKLEVEKLTQDVINLNLSSDDEEENDETEVSNTIQIRS